MARSDWYLTHQEMPAYGKMHFLKILQRADSEGGGESLLGSVVQEVNEYGPLGLFQVGWYPVPMHMSVPRGVLKCMESRKDDMGADGFVVSIPLSSVSSSVTVKRGRSFDMGISAFPGLPLGCGVDVDYSRMESIAISFDHARLNYIPLAYLGRLYRAVDGNHRLVDESGALGRNNVVTSILLARNYSVQFKSSDKFKSGFESKLKAFQAVPGMNASYEMDDADERSLKASVKGDVEYLVAIGVKDWEDFDLD